MPHSYIGVASLLAAVGAPASEAAALLTAAEAGSEEVDSDCGGRFFQPRIATRYCTGSSSGELLLTDADLLAVLSIKTDADGDGVYETTWLTTDFVLGPPNAPANLEPYWRIRSAGGGSYSFPCGGADGVQIVGKWGFQEDLLTLAATTNEDLDATETAITLTATGELEVGNTIQIGDEQMYVTAIASPNLTVERGANGTTAAIHATLAPVKLHRYPRDIVQAAKLNAVKNYRRKDAPFGVTGSDAMGTTIVPRFDADYERKIRRYRLLAAA